MLTDYTQRIVKRVIISDELSVGGPTYLFDTLTANSNIIVNDTLSVGRSIHITETLFTSNIISSEYINIDADQVNIKGISLSDGKFEVQSSNI